jgi:hypothetical protein
VADDEMVEQPDVQELAGLHDGAGDGDIIIIYMENLFDTLYVSR